MEDVLPTGRARRGDPVVPGDEPGERFADPSPYAVKLIAARVMTAAAPPKGGVQ